MDREEVEELHERDADDAEDREPQQASAIDAQCPGERMSTMSIRPMHAPAHRASVSRSDERPDESATFATEPLMPKSVAAANTSEAEHGLRTRGSRGRHDDEGPSTGRNLRLHLPHGT